ncbi:MAG: hypothetical protein MK299_04700 [Pseudomonadales bacterium]|nr:hypothetical protein [Pseudomonadales bacterium]
MRKNFGIAILLTVASPVLSQENLAPQDIDDVIDSEARIESIRQSEGRALNVIAPTIAPEEIDRVVLNRLMQQIARDPDTVRAQLEVSDEQLQDIFITISNARNFVNNSEMANVRAMCRAFNDSELQGDARIQKALDAYKVRARFTTNFIARYYRIVLANVEVGLSDVSLTLFNEYMEDRRRRMANAGTVTWGVVVENISSGTESVEFHCHRQN